MIGAGFLPGNSSDLDAVVLAKTYGARKIINLTNTDYVYDSDPKKNQSAKPIREISWEDYRKIVGSKWRPRLNSPFDPIASKIAEESKLEVVIANGRKLDNLGKILQGKKFVGTLIS
jgi:uridylate kinase